METTGDGFFLRFDGPGRAVRAAIAIRDAIPELGLDVRCGLHIGECDLSDGKPTGLAVHTAARVAAAAAPGQVAVTSAVRDILGGSGLLFDDLGHRELRGIPGTWELFAAAATIDEPDATVAG